MPDNDFYKNMVYWDSLQILLFNMPLKILNLS